MVIVPINGSFEEFPKDPELNRFDVSDRKFVATALTSKHSPTILNALDSDWRDHEKALCNNNIIVNELCGNCLKGNP